MNLLANKSVAERRWLFGGAFAAFVLLVVGYFLLIGPQRSQTSEVNGQIASARTQNATLQARIDDLRAQSLHPARYRTALVAAEQALPSTSGLSDFLRSLQSLGASTLTHVTSLTVGAPTDVSAVAAAAPAAGVAVPAGAVTTPAATPTPTASTPAATGTTPVTTAGGVFGLTISAQVNGSPAALNQFLDQLQSVQPRAVLITELTEGTGTSGTANPSTASHGTTLQLTMQAFVAPVGASENAQLAAAAGR